MEEYIHLAILGILCEKLGKSKLINPKSTRRPNAVTCPKMYRNYEEYGGFEIT